MIIFFWIVVGTIVASTLVALLCYKRSEMTLSEIAEKLESRNLSLQAQAACMRGMEDSQEEWSKERGAIEQESRKIYPIRDTGSSRGCSRICSPAHRTFRIH
jgi:hypothetical protein